MIRQPSSLSGRPPSTYVYKFVPDLVDQLKSENPIQLSFLLIHEWLWDFSSHVDRNRRINYWLHSDRLESWTREEWLANLKGIGFPMPSEQPVVFSEASCPPDLNKSRRLAELAEGQELYLGSGSPHQRTKGCDDRNCGPYYFDNDHLFAQYFAGSPRLKISFGRLVVYSKQGWQTPESFSCKF